MKNIPIFKNYKRTNDIDNISVDFIEQLARSVVDTTISKVILNKRGENVPPHWEKAIEKVKNNNDIERILKTDTRYKSKYGKSYVGFDMYGGVPILWVAENNERNQAIRLNGMEQFAVRVRRKYSAANNAVILQNEVVYTKEDASYLFLGGFGSGILNNPSPKESQKHFEQVSEQVAFFPFDWVSLKTPDYILQQHKTGTHPHNLGVLPAREFLNKDVADYGLDNYLSDWYPAKEYIPLIDSILNFIAWELQLDHTRIMGMFSFQDLEGMKSNARDITNSLDPQKRLNEIINNYFVGELNNQMNNGSDMGAIQKKLVVKTIGSEGSALEKMNSTFDGAKHIGGLQALITLIYDICGYSWSNQASEESTYENVSQTQQSLRGVFETTKEKNELFTRQWKDLLKDLFFVLIKEETGNFEYDKKQAYDEFDLFVHFEIVSNIILSQSNDWRKNMELKNANMLSLERAIKLTWPEMNDSEVLDEVDKINQQSMFQKPFVNDFNAFDNQKPFQSSPNNQGEEQYD